MADANPATQTAATGQGNDWDKDVIAFKQELNRIHPLLIGGAYTPVAETADINDKTFQDTLKNFTTTVQTYLAGLPGDMKAVAGDKAGILQQVKPTGQLDENTLKALDMLRDKADTAEFRTDIENTTDDFGSFHDKFKTLPADVQQKINASLVTPLSPPAQPEGATQKPDAGATTPAVVSMQAPATIQRQIEIVDRAEDILGIENSGSTNVGLDTARAMKEQLKLLQQQNPELDDPNFIPQEINGKSTLGFMNALVKKQMDKTGVTEDTLNSTVLQIWAMEQNGQGDSISAEMKELSNTVALRDFVAYMSSGSLSNGLGSTLPPTTRMPWAYDAGVEQEPDRFFAGPLNKALVEEASYGRMDTRFDGGLLIQGTHEDQRQRILDAAEKLGFIEGGENAYDQLLKLNFDRRQIGQMAAEIMVAQAKDLCIEESEITSAIMEGKFNPDLNDLALVEEGFGNPEDRPQGRVDWLNSIGIRGDEQTDYWFMAHFASFRAEKFADRFGKVTEEQATPLADNYVNSISSYSDEDRARILPKWIDTHQSPLSIYRVQAEGAYEPLRQKHLWNLKDRAVDGGESCEAKPEEKPAAATSGGDDGLCYADQHVQPDCGDDKDGLCYADDQKAPEHCGRIFEGEAKPLSQSEIIEKVTYELTGQPTDVLPGTTPESDHSAQPATANP